MSIGAFPLPVDIVPIARSGAYISLPPPPPWSPPSTSIIVAGEDSTNFHSLMLSTNHGVTWTTVSSDLDNCDGAAVAWDGTQWVAVGFGVSCHVSIVTSPNGVAWTTRTPSSNWTSAVIPEPTCISGNGSLWIAGRQSNNAGSPPPTGLVTSTDGITWTDRTIPWDGEVGTSVGQRPKRIVWVSGLSKWVIGGLKLNGTQGGVLTSSDGMTWTAQSTPFDGTFPDGIYDMAYDGSQLIAVGVDSSATHNVMTSPDGITWTTRSAPITSVALAVATSGSLWVIGLDHTATHAIMTSPDGITWTTQTTPFDGSGGGICAIVWDGAQFIAGADNFSGGMTHIVMTSPDGVTWTAQTTPFDSGFVNGIGVN